NKSHAFNAFTHLPFGRKNVVMDATGDRHFQAFRSHSTSEVFHVQTKLDKTTGQQAILWKDILLPCPDAKYVVNGTKVVSFMTGDDFEDLIPLRIEHHPHTTLEVVLRNTGNKTDDTSGNTITRLSAISPLEAEPSNSPTQAGKLRSQVGRPCYPTHLSKSHVSSTIGLTGRSATTALESQASLESYPLVIVDSQVNQTTGIMAAIDQHFNNLKVEMEKIKALKTQLVQTQKNIHQAQHHVEEKQQEVTQTQKQFLSPLAIIQNRTKVLLSKTYELHESSFPRLFIILPYPEERQDTFGRLTSDQFRLFFLCECTKHTTTEGGDILDEIHLANHEGYHISKPTEFFEKFGSYILTVMQMFKYGIAIAGAVVPPLEEINVVKGMDKIQKYIDLTENTIGTMIDESISFLEQQQKRTPNGAGTTDQIGFDELEGLEYPDLSCLKSYLRVRERAYVLGGLYRIITVEGHVKWVCADHSQTNRRDDAIHSLGEIVKVNRGIFMKKLGAVHVGVASSTLARQIYDAMVKAQPIQKLVISMGWQTTMDDLIIFTDAVTQASVKHLEIIGSPTREIVVDTNEGDLHDSIFIRLASRGKIQSLHLGGIDDFSKRVSSSSWMTSQQLRVFKYSPSINPREGDTESFLSAILNNIPGLAELQLRTSQVESLVVLVADKLGLPQFSVVTDLEANCWNSGVVASLRFSFQRISLTSTAPNGSGETSIGHPEVNLNSRTNLRLIISNYEPESFTEDLLSLHSKYDWPIGNIDVVASNFVFYPMARFLDELTEMKAPKHLSLSIKDTLSVSTRDLQHMERVVGRAQYVTKLGIYFGKLKAEAEQEKLRYLHGPIGKRLTKLVFEGDIPGPCIPALLTKDLLPMLKSFKAVNMNLPFVSEDWIQYIVAMASISSGSRDTLYSGTSFRNVSSIPPPESTTSTYSLRDGTPLRKFKINSNRLQPKDWVTLIRALDFMTLESVSFQNSSFSLEQLGVLVDHVPGEAGKLSAVSLQSLNLTWTDIEEGDDNAVLEQFTRLKKKIPHIEIIYGDSEDPIFWP
ncbi:hypothetical protein BGX21_009346, partial [Mortierella sp. AD011]